MSVSPTGKPISLATVRVNYALKLAYRARLDALVDEMAMACDLGLTC